MRYWEFITKAEKTGQQILTLKESLNVLTSVKNSSSVYFCGKYSANSW